MKQNIITMSPALAAALFTVSGCSTIIEGRSQEVTVITSPPGATCELARNGTPLGSILPTPGSMYIEKTKYDIMITCDKPGYETATYLNHSGAAGATVGNILRRWHRLGH